MQAVVKISGSQYLVSEGDELLVNRLNLEDNKLTLNDVLLVDGDKEFKVGKPFISDCHIEAEILGEEKGDKIRVSKYKAKSRYRRTVGFRSKLNRIRIEKIVLKK